MARQTTLVSALKKFGLEVEYVPGWSTRGSSSFDPKGVMAHWTAGPRNSTSRPSLGVVTNGRPGLPGPLCNVYLDRRGVCVVVAAGRANHAGRGNWKGVTAGNSGFFGVEAEAADNSDWTDAQKLAYPVLNAALLSIIKEKRSAMVCGHSEYALPKGRKIDINGYTTTQLRKQTQGIIDGGPAAGKKRLSGTGAVKPTTPSKPKPKPKTDKPKPSKSKNQSWENQPDGSANFPENYDNLVVDGEFKKLTVGAQQILMENIKVGKRYNQRWDGDWGSLSIKDAQEWLKWAGFYRTTATGVKLKIDGKDGYWFWRELQRFLRHKGFYNKAKNGVVLKLDGKPGSYTYMGWQRYLNTQN